MQQCTLSFKSFKYIYIENSCKQIYQTMAFWKIPVHSCSFIGNPTLRKKLTLLRSPHIHKKSREQFEWVRKKGKLKILFLHQRHLLLLLFWLQHCRFPGVQLAITLSHSTILPMRRGKDVTFGTRNTEMTWRNSSGVRTVES